MNKENCLECHWYRAMTRNPTDGGLCRQSAPTLDAGKCGEWKPREQAEAAARLAAALPGVLVASAIAPAGRTR